MSLVIIAGIYLLVTVFAVDMAWRASCLVRRKLASGPEIQDEHSAGFLLSLSPPVAGIVVASVFGAVFPLFQFSDYVQPENAISSATFGTLIALGCVFIAIGSIYSAGIIRTTIPPRHQMKSRLSAFTLVSVDLLLSAAFEELVFRGQLLTCLLRGFHDTAAIGIAAVIFGALHLWKHPQAPLLWGINTALFGVLASQLLLATGSLAAPIALHFVWNIIETPILGLPANGADYDRGLLISRLRGPGILTGGGWSMDAGLVSTGAIISSIATMAIIS